MAEVYKNLGQQNPVVTTLTDLYTVPAGKSAVVSSIVICNRGAATTFRLAIAPAGAADDNKHYLYYDTAIGANDTLVLTAGLTLAATDKIRCYAGAATLSFGAWGSELG